MEDNTGIARFNIEREVDRYIAWPGQALAYKIGEITIRDLRDEARKRLGAAFDLRAFHDQVLADGPLPLDMLTTQVNDWIVRQRRMTDASRTTNTSPLTKKTSAGRCFGQGPLGL